VQVSSSRPLRGGFRFQVSCFKFQGSKFLIPSGTICSAVLILTERSASLCKCLILKERSAEPCRFQGPSSKVLAQMTQIISYSFASCLRWSDLLLFFAQITQMALGYFSDLIIFAQIAQMSSLYYATLTNKRLSVIRFFANNYPEFVSYNITCPCSACIRTI